MDQETKNEFNKVHDEFGEMHEKFAHVDSEFEKVHEQLKKHDAQFEKVHEQLKKHDAQFEKVHEQLRKHDVQFERIALILVEHGDRLDRIDERMASLVTKEDHQEVMNVLQALMAMMEGLKNEHLAGFERDNHIEAKVAEHDVQIKSLQKHVGLVA